MAGVNAALRIPGVHSTLSYGKPGKFDQERSNRFAPMAVPIINIGFAGVPLRQGKGPLGFGSVGAGRARPRSGVAADGAG
jgi:hypothetical protein